MRVVVCILRPRAWLLLKLSVNSKQRLTEETVIHDVLDNMGRLVNNLAGKVGLCFSILTTNNLAKEFATIICGN